VFWTIALGALAADQAVKALVRTKMTEGDSIPVWPGVLEIAYVRNQGAAFGMLQGATPIFVATTTLVLIAIAAYWRRSRPTAWPVVVGLALVTGGAVGNLIDRVMLGGRVTDFIYVSLIRFPVFNIADSCIFVGVVLLIGWLLLVPDATEASAPANGAAAGRPTEPGDAGVSAGDDGTAT